MTDFKNCFLSKNNTIADALNNLNSTGYRAVLVVKPDGKLDGLVTDWDLRTALLNGKTLDCPLADIMNPNPITGDISLLPAGQYELMINNGIECLPIIDAERRVCDFRLLRDMVKGTLLPTSMVVMAGGKGKRLWPLTEETPKPLLPVGDRPILHHILTHAQAQGLQNIWVSTHYKSEKIEAFLNEATPEGLRANILKEENPLGTAGCLKTLKGTQDPNQPIFIINGDILTRLDFKSMLDWHNAHGNLLTVGCRLHSYEIPYGVLEADGQKLINIEEKPVITYKINAGIYLIEQQALDYIPENVYFDMPDLINALLADNRMVGIFPISESWVDIGNPDDYSRVNQESHLYIPSGVS